MYTIKSLIFLLFQWASCLTAYKGFHKKNAHWFQGGPREILELPKGSVVTQTLEGFLRAWGWEGRGVGHPEGFFNLYSASICNVSMGLRVPGESCGFRCSWRFWDWVPLSHHAKDVCISNKI